jgi:hypothetical protein
MVPDPAQTALGLRYFVNRDEALAAGDASSASAPRRSTGSAHPPVASSTARSCACRAPAGLRSRLPRASTPCATTSGRPNLEMIGRNGQHRYNQDHSMLTGIHAA